VRVIRLIAVNVFKESVRDKVLYNLVAFAVLLIASTFLLGQLTAGQDIKIIKDLGLAAISLFGLMIAVFIGIGLVWKEVDKRSIYGVLSKPVRRFEFVLGKFFGLLLTLAVNLLVMTLAFYVVLALNAWMASPATLAAMTTPAADPALLKAILLIGIELSLVTAIALFFSTFSSPFLSAGLTIGLWVIGHFNADFRNFGDIVDSPAAIWLTRTLYYVLPNFAAFDIKSQVVWGQPVAAADLALTTLYGFVYVTLTVTGAVTIFSRRDLK
jgi:ABC-type transport system involved in multi-copper enzyme maturation permease subunit